MEVFFPGLGWINFNPTADRPAGGVGGLGSLDLMPQDEPFISPDLGDLFGDGLTPDDIPSPVTDALAETPTVNEPFNWMIVWVLAGILTVVAAAGLTGRVAWNWGMGGLEGRAQLWAKTQRLAGWTGLGSRPAETPREWSRRMGRAIEQEQAALHALGRLRRDAIRTPGPAADRRETGVGVVPEPAGCAAREADAAQAAAAAFEEGVTPAGSAR